MRVGMMPNEGQIFSSPLSPPSCNDMYSCTVQCCYVSEMVTPSLFLLGFSLFWLSRLHSKLGHTDDATGDTQAEHE
jgi:predicted metal-binding protein